MNFNVTLLISSAVTCWDSWAQFRGWFRSGERRQAFSQDPASPKAGALGWPPAGPGPFFSSHLPFLFGASRGRVEIKPLVPHGCFIESGRFLKKTKSTVLFYMPSSLHVERQKPAQCREKTACGPAWAHLRCCRVSLGGADPRAGATFCVHSVPRPGALQALCLPLTGRHPDEVESSRGHLGVGGPVTSGRVGWHTGDPLRDSAHCNEDEG